MNSLKPSPGMRSPRNVRQLLTGPTDDTRRPRARMLPLLLGAALVSALALGGFSAAGLMRAGAPHAATPVRSAAPVAHATAIDPALDRPQRLAPNSPEALAPVRLVIPKLRLNAPILGLGPDASGAMQAPRTGGPSDPIWSEVYWWNVGAMPGQIGNAVIAGHVNRPDASPSTFTYLDRLVPGDQIQVVTRGGRTLVFVVTDKDAPLVYVHGDNDPTIQRIFGPAITPNLNLMTCWGEWDGTQFNRRLVVYSKLVGSAPFPSNSGIVSGG